MKLEIASLSFRCMAKLLQVFESVGQHFFLYFFTQMEQ